MKSTLETYTPQGWARLVQAIQGTGDLDAFLDGCADWIAYDRHQLVQGSRGWQHLETGQVVYLPVKGQFADDDEIRADALLATVRHALGLPGPRRGGVRGEGDGAVCRAAAVLVLHHPDGHGYPPDSTGRTRRCSCGLSHPCATFLALLPPEWAV